MPSMTYCRHENTARELDQVWEMWEDTNPDDLSEYEASGRRRIIRLVREMHQQFAFDGTYDEDDEGDD